MLGEGAGGNNGGIAAVALSNGVMASVNLPVMQQPNTSK